MGSSMYGLAPPKDRVNGARRWDMASSSVVLQFGDSDQVEQTISEDVAEATTAHDSGTPALEQ